MKNLITLSLLFIASISYGQKTNVYVNAGTFGLVHSLNLNLEYQISTTIEGKAVYYIRGSYGVLQGTYYNSDNDIKPIYKYSLEGVGLYGKGKSKFELQFGLSYLENTSNHRYSSPDRLTLAGGLGYRFVNKNFMFRTGVSFPDGVYVGVGYSF